MCRVFRDCGWVVMRTGQDKINGPYKTQSSKSLEAETWLKT